MAISHKLHRRLGPLGRKLMAHAQGTDNSQHVWEIVEQTGNYTISTRPMQLLDKGDKSHTSAGSFKIEFMINDAPIEKIFKWFTKQKNRKQDVNEIGKKSRPSGWYHTKETTKTTSGNERHFSRLGYKYIPFPMPFSDRLVCSDQEILYLKDSEVIASMASTTKRALDSIPPNMKQGTVRTHLYIGGHVFRQIDENTTKVIYVFSGDLKGLIPRTLTDMVAYKELRHFHDRCRRSFEKK
eukprot:g4031.t1